MIELLLYGIYGCFDRNGVLQYVGSTSLALFKLEYNHRNYYKFANSYESEFRKALRQSDGWYFEWIERPRKISRMQCEIEEGAIIRLLKPVHNQDPYPYESSVKNGRMYQI